MLKIMGDQRSGNCYKVKLLCHLLGLEYEWSEVDILQGGTRSAHFLAINPNGQIPLCITTDHEVIAESNAILFHLAEGSSFWPTHRLAQTRVLEWMFFEQYSHEPAIAVARFINLYQKRPASREKEYQSKLKAGERVLNQMKQFLSEHDFLVSNRCTISDISLYAYTHVADEGGFNLSGYPAINAWIARIAAQPGYIGIGQ